MLILSVLRWVVLRKKLFHRAVVYESILWIKILEQLQHILPTENLISVPYDQNKLLYVKYTVLVEIYLLEKVLQILNRDLVFILLL